MQRETTKTVDFGLLRREADGNRAYYQARRDFFLFSESRDIFLKTSFVAQVRQWLHRHYPELMAEEQEAGDDQAD